MNLLFDLDGTLIDSERGLVQSFKKALAEIGVDSDDVGLRRLIGPPAQEGLAEFYGLRGDVLSQTVARFRSYLKEGGLLDFDLYPGIEELLIELKKAGHRLFLATSKPTAMAETVIEHLRWQTLFSGISGAVIGVYHDKTRVIAHLLPQLQGLNVMIGDRHHDIEGAKANGLLSIGVCYGFGGKEELSRAGADYLAADTEELRHRIYDIEKGI